MIRRLAAGLAGAHAWLSRRPRLPSTPSRPSRKGSFVISPEVAYGNQFNLEGKHEFSDVQFVNARRALRLAALQPGRARARSSARWSSGLEPLYQQYFEPEARVFRRLWG